MFLCGWQGDRIQPHLTDMETGQIRKPVVTNKNKAFVKFWNNSNYVCNRIKGQEQGHTLYFEADLLNSGYLRNVKFYSFEQCLELFPEQMI
jgi:hypothetical protein